uniref:Uncharacterized protein n=1 Tax=Anabas testudineus TaxID=64144 RepID=A0A3Q1I4I0_ANATE
APSLKHIHGQLTEECVPKYLGFDYSYHSVVDYLNCEDSLQNNTTIKRLSLKRRPKAATNNVEKTQNDISSSHWRSAESLSASSSDDSRVLGMSSTTRRRPPLPPPHASSSDNKSSRSETSSTSQILNELKPKPAARALASQKQSSMMEKTVVETHTHLDQEVLNQPPPQPFPRRRLASFGGVSSPGSLSPFTGLGAYNQNDENEPPGTRGDKFAHLSLSLGSRGSTGCLMLSPQSSGRTTPVTSLSPMRLQHVRDQMVIALQRLKELEEQVKIIPILQVKVSVLQEEKRQLVSQLKDQSDNEGINEAIWKRIERSDVENKLNTEEGFENIERIDCSDLREIMSLTEEVQALEKNIKGRHLQELLGKGLNPLHDKSIVVGESHKDKDAILCKPTKESKYVYTSQVEMRSIATGVSEVNLGTYIEQEAELEAQQITIEALKEKICLLEAELKESALQTEMSRLKLELHVAGARNRADKACLARPSTVSTGVEARPHTTSQGVGNHTEVRDASIGGATGVRTVGVSCCGPELKNVCTGPDVLMSHWEIRERVETLEKCMGIQVFTNTIGVGTEILLCDAETNTEVPVENIGSKKGKTNYHSVACGDCSVDVVICEAKEMVSQGMATEPVRGVDLGVMSTPQTSSQHTNTVSSAVSRFTNTKHAFSTDSSTNTLLSTQDKHTNTNHTVTRDVSVGNRGRNIRCTPETRTIGVGTANAIGNSFKQAQETAKVTRDTGVGFTNVNENFLIGLKTRNMASGPSHLPDPITTRSIGVGEGKIRDLSGHSVQQSTQSQWDSELNHYIEKMQMLLGEHGDLLTEDYTEQYGGRGNNSSKLFGNNKPASQGGTEARHLESQLPGNITEIMWREIQSPSELSVDSSKCDKANPAICQQGGNESEVKRMIQMLEQQASSALQGKHTCFCVCVIISDSFVNLHSKYTKPYEKIFSACQALKTHLSGDTALSSKELQNCQETLQQEWFSVSSHKTAAPDTVEDCLSAFRVISPSVLQHMVNMADINGNTALHYSVSHSNFGIAKKLLDADVCNVNQQNKAGYTPIMLAALAAVETPEDMRVVEQLFTKGNVNAKASQAGQTALMLAVSHGRMDMVQALLAQGAEVNLQDDEGSTALMCASEHGHAGIVKLLLSQPDCDATLTDSDESTALSIALEAGHNDIAVLLYAHANFSKGQTGVCGSTTACFPGPTLYAKLKL